MFRTTPSFRSGSWPSATTRVEGGSHSSADGVAGDDAVPLKGVQDLQRLLHRRASIYHTGVAATKTQVNATAGSRCPWIPLARGKVVRSEVARPPAHRHLLEDGRGDEDAAKQNPEEVEVGRAGQVNERAGVTDDPQARLSSCSS